MPLYREWSSDPYSLAAIWEITEPESFFTGRTGLQPDIKNEKKRLEHLAARFLLKHLQHDFPLLSIQPDIHDKPRLKDNQYFFSLSHSYPYVAAVVSPYVECGIDLQVWRHRMQQLQHKFLSAEEQPLFKGNSKLITLAWCAKEAAYKWQGRRGVEFSEHLSIKKLTHHFHHYLLDVSLQLTRPQIQLVAEGNTESNFAYSVISNRTVLHPSF